MAATLHSFMDIFDTTFGEGEEAVKIQKIIIPIIQRDYAQGRDNKAVERVRERFLDSLYKAVTDKPVTLDFVYGDIDKEGRLTPLDGQQRLTTLFLLHWYAAKKEQIPKDEYGFLERFSYETRYSARYFCIELVDYTPKFEEAISEELKNQAWFPLDWEKDPTISSMLVMLDAIASKFNEVKNLWKRLKDRCITFYFLPIKDMGLTDELYIKMNSRGKPLTPFEHFKAELEREIDSVLRDNAVTGKDRNVIGGIKRKIDRDWTDLLWQYRDSGTGTEADTVIDDEFLRYFKFVCKVIYYEQGGQAVLRGDSGDDELDLLQKYFSSECKNAVENLKRLAAFFDCWCKIGQTTRYVTPEEFVKSFISHGHEVGKIKILKDDTIDVFADCLSNDNFNLKRFVMLYAIATYLQKADKVTEVDFKRRIRIVNNLIKNSDNEITDRTDRNRMSAILEKVNEIIVTGSVDVSGQPSFNLNQLSEEKEKIDFLQQQPQLAEVLFKLEDHELLNGQISIVGLNKLKDYASSFESLFNCSLDEIDRALMAIDDYGQVERNRWRRQYGSTLPSTWQVLFHKGANSGFEKTREVLWGLLAKQQAFTNGTLQVIYKGFLDECEKNHSYPWRYYYIKYQVSSQNPSGKIYKDPNEKSPYLFLVMTTTRYRSHNSYMLYLKAADEAHLVKEDLGMSLARGNEHIKCIGNGYEIERRRYGKLEEKREVIVPQNANGEDAEDRVVVLQHYLKKDFAWLDSHNVEIRSV